MWLKDLPRRTALDKLLRDKAFNIAKNLKYEYQRGLASMIYVFDTKTAGGAAIKSKNILKKQLAEELYKPITRKF